VYNCLVTAYDRVAYPTEPFLESHPDRLRLVGHLFGLAPPPVERCRVLELACGDGGNLIPIAEMFPEAQLCGVDTARARIDEGVAVARELGLANLRLEAMDLAAVDGALGEFDYVIAHGVYSWVEPAIRARLLDVIAERLTPGGVAFVSHNVQPGWAPRGLARAMMRYHTRGVTDERERVAHGRALLGLLGGAARDPRWRALLAQQSEAVHQQPDGLVFHDYLGEVNDACWFHELAAELPPRGLQWLGDADLTTMLPLGHPPAAVAALGRLASGPIEREQYLDFLTMRAFRMTLVCRAGLPLDRSPGADRLRDLHVSSSATRGEADATFHTQRGVTARIAAPATLAALDALAAAWPASLPLAGLGARALDLLELAVAGVVELSMRPAALTVAPGAQPAATPYARWQAARGARVTTRRHETVTLDATQARLLALCDGTRDRARLARELELPAEPIAAQIERLSYGALLVR
jgi:SAM-dependent methyltransferase